MTHQPHELSNLKIALSYFESLPADDLSRRYAAGEKFASGVVNRLKFFFSIDSVLGELNKFYPYQPIVKRTYEIYQEKKAENTKAAAVFSGLSIISVYQLAKQNYLIPVFKKFCMFNTHRLFRQYLALAILPVLLAQGYTNYFFLNQTEKLWGVHASRLNEGKFDDPQDSQYPVDQLPVSQVHSYVSPYVHKFDLVKKWANEVQIFLAPDYENVEEWEKVPVKEAEEEEDIAADGEEEED